MNDYTEVMRKRTDSELLEITTTLRGDYKAEAVSAAEAELEKRNLTSQQLAEAQMQLAQKKQEQERKNERLEALKNKAAALTDTFNPLMGESTGKTIKIITAGIAVYFIAHLIKNWDLLVLMTGDIGNAELGALEYFAPLVLFPIGLYGFWTTKKYGWIILVILFTYLAVTALFSMGIDIKWAMSEPVQPGNNGFIHFQEVENPALDQFFGRKSFSLLIGQIIIPAGFLVFLNRKKITERYRVSRKIQLLTVGLTAVPIILLGLIILV